MDDATMATSTCDSLSLHCEPLIASRSQRIPAPFNIFRNEEFCSGESNPEVIEEVLQEAQRKSEIDKSSVGKRDWISLLAEPLAPYLTTITAANTTGEEFHHPTNAGSSSEPSTDHRNRRHRPSPL
nr:uncharacterized protein LOC109148134 [Ipomoea batatas]